MARIPISFTKFTTNTNLGNEVINYLVKVEDKGSSWDQSIQCDRRELERLLKDLQSVLSGDDLSEALGLSKADADRLEQMYETDSLCKQCSFKSTKTCVVCAFEIESPLERAMFVDLTKMRIRFQRQYGIDRQGSPIHINGRSDKHPTNNFINVLTIPDFYIESKGERICIYADGHTFHEKSEDQVMKDRNQDRQLQEFGYRVLRFTGKEIREHRGKFTETLQKWQ